MNAFLICGPESSGNRLWARILVAAGCYGDGSTVQRLDVELNKKIGAGNRPENIVWVRSYPHGSEEEDRHWPDISYLRYLLNSVGYDRVYVLVPHRDIFCMASSQVNKRHVPNIQIAHQNIQTAMVMVATSLAVANMKGIQVSYESLVQHSLEYVNRLLAFVEMPLLGKLPEEIYDGNEPYYR
jgi:hypothetical protein